MTAQRLDGKALADELILTTQQAVDHRTQAGYAQPGLDVILVGNNPASASYVKHKQAACQRAHIRSTCHHLPDHTTQEEIEAQIDQCNANPKTHGILLQLPLPKHINPAPLLARIAPEKDVDGFHPYNMGRLTQSDPMLRPCTPKGVMSLLKQTGQDLTGQHAVMVGASNIVGRPMALELLTANCTVTVCHHHTTNLASHVQAADILISATGHFGVIASDWIKPGAIVIDVGFSKLENGQITGDIDFETAQHRASWITPVPGGVGPMTVASLIENTLQAHILQTPP